MIMISGKWAQNVTEVSKVKIEVNNMENRDDQTDDNLLGGVRRGSTAISGHPAAVKKSKNVQKITLKFCLPRIYTFHIQW